MSNAVEGTLLAAPIDRSQGPGRLRLISVAAFAAVGSLKVPIKEYDVPTPHARPHDPTVAPDGSLWVTEQLANKLGRLDPGTGKFKEYPLKTPDSGPHGLVADKQENIWFAAIFAGYVGKLNPKTGAITEYRAPGGTKIDPHTPVFDHNGILWFTNEETNYIGRLDPATGEMQLKQVPTPHAVPYGIVVTKTGVPFFCEFGTNKLGSIDPKTMAIREYSLPDKDARPRRLALAPDGTLYYTDYARIPRALRSGEREAVEGMGFAGRAGIPPLRDSNHQQRRGLVQRIRRAS